MKKFMNRICLSNVYLSGKNVTSLFADKADISNISNVIIHTVKKGFTSFPSPAEMSLTKLPLGRNNSVMTSLFPPRESLVV
jgi:hypothetical protein